MTPEVLRPRLRPVPFALAYLAVVALGVTGGVLGVLRVWPIPRQVVDVAPRSRLIPYEVVDPGHGATYAVLVVVPR